MIWYNLRRDKSEIRVDNETELVELQEQGYTLMSVVNTAAVSKCKEGNR